MKAEKFNIHHHRDRSVHVLISSPNGRLKNLVDLLGAIPHGVAPPHDVGNGVK
jgi:hypothetical protein